MNLIDHKKIADPPKPPSPRDLFKEADPFMAKAILLAVIITSVLVGLAYLLSLTNPVIKAVPTGGC